MKDLIYYNTLRTPYKNLSDFKEKLFQELESFVGTRTQLKDKEAVCALKASELLKEHQKVRREEKATLYAEFKADLAASVVLHWTDGLTNHPKLDKLFDIAERYGEDEGLEGIQEKFEELSELLT